MRVLFVPYPDGIASHGVPLLALRRLCDASIDTAFLVPAKARHLGSIAAVDVLDYDFTGALTTELDAYRHFRPDVVIDDCNPATCYAAAATGVARVTVLRLTAFPGYRPRDPHQGHTLPVADRVARWIGSEIPPPTVESLCAADGHVIPAVPSIEPPAAAMAGDARHAYAGPLNLPDDWMMRLMVPSDRALAQHDALSRFLDRHAQRPIAFMTFGIAQGFREEGRACVRGLIARGVAVISTFSAGELGIASRPLHYWSDVLPMHRVCARAAVVIHQCGSGTYHYPLLHGVPAVTLGTGFYDREDVALRLEELALSVHVRAGADERDYAGRVIEAACGWLEPAVAADYRRRVRPLQEEIAHVSAAFHLRGLLDRALDYSRRRNAAAIS